MARITPEMQAEAQRLVERHGGIKPAARATGLSYGTIWRRVNPEKARSYDVDYTARDPERRVEQNLDSTRAWERRMRATGRCVQCGGPARERRCGQCADRQSARRAYGPVALLERQRAARRRGRINRPDVHLFNDL